MYRFNEIALQFDDKYFNGHPARLSYPEYFELQGSAVLSAGSILTATFMRAILGSWWLISRCV